MPSLPSTRWSAPHFQVTLASFFSLSGPLVSSALCSPHPSPDSASVPLLLFGQSARLVQHGCWRYLRFSEKPLARLVWPGLQLLPTCCPCCSDFQTWFLGDNSNERYPKHAICLFFMGQYFTYSKGLHGSWLLSRRGMVTLTEPSENMCYTLITSVLYVECPK